MKLSIEFCWGVHNLGFIDRVSFISILCYLNRFSAFYKTHGAYVKMEYEHISDSSKISEVSDVLINIIHILVNRKMGILMLLVIKTFGLKDFMNYVGRPIFILFSKMKCFILSLTRRGLPLLHFAHKPIWPLLTENSYCEHLYPGGKRNWIWQYMIQE